VERQASAQFRAGEPEQLFPECASEDWVTVTHDGLWHAMKPDNVVEEGLGDHRGGVGVAEGEEVCVLGEPVHHG
jgi:hypothetical protein